MKIWFEVIAEHENWRDLVDVFETLEEAKKCVKDYEDAERWFGRTDYFKFFINVVID